MTSCFESNSSYSLLEIKEKINNFETPNITGYEVELIIKIAESMNWDLS